MIIPNPIVKLDYNPSKDVLVVVWPDFNEYAVSEAMFVMDAVIETIRHYDVKYLLTDTRNRMISIPDAVYKEMMLKFTRDLAATRLQRMARVVTESSRREKPISEVRQEANLGIPMQHFYSVEEALDWLTSQK
ncbi:hypothetical protein [Pontibacter chitinilyticus]|uniref:hypothetical protein n=1 Tax=Pontibacter chitinilyticus TaxID=2674989 RepID=UPI00321B6BC1